MREAARIATAFTVKRSEFCHRSYFNHSTSMLQPSDGSKFSTMNLLTLVVFCSAGSYALCKVNRVAQFYIKYTMFMIWHLILGLLVTIASLLTNSFGDTANMWWWNFFAHYLSFEMLFSVHIEMLNTPDRLGVNEPCVFVINHQTSLDQLPYLKCWAPGRCSILAKNSLKYTLTYGLGCIASGVFFVDRKNPAQARATSDRCVKFLKEERGKLWIYPEGTRSHAPDTDLLPFKKGAFHIAVQAQVPIVPIVVSRYRHMYSSKEKKFDRVDMKVDVLPNVPTKGLTSDDVPELTESVRTSMLKRFHEISPPLRQ
ncbi:1-acyl-sn-glycerol-3-phosphate acyltransferase alpha-like [Acanthaster planci]|uniref:1-acylglycerol-3-phosphate O-acyltransferase n=1 Tax=Acanthaster planci TaxID=133434 RepID=A0A8B7YYM1_ACAPL|nr:1-acyl-sn-glycerol-3-phosphate acyltransferase alpha-like [Acanthaster planci]